METAREGGLSRAAARVRSRRSDRAGGSQGNERLTGSTAIVLLVLLAAEGLTIVGGIRGTLSAHVFIGMLLIPPVALKLGSTGWRFVRYYTRNPEYRRKGPPHPLMRLLAPVVVLSTIGVFGTAIAMFVVGSGGGTVLLLHKASFVVWLVATGAHVLYHVLRVPRLALADWRRRERVGGAATRKWLLLAALLLGVVLAWTTLPLAEPWLAPLRRHFFGDG